MSNALQLNYSKVGGKGWTLCFMGSVTSWLCLFLIEPRFPSAHLFEQRSPPPPPPPPLLNSTHPVPSQNPLPFGQPGPGFNQQGQHPVFPRERLVRPNIQPQGPVNVLHFSQPGAANTRPFLPPRQPFLQVPGQPFLATHSQVWNRNKNSEHRMCI